MRHYNKTFNENHESESESSQIPRVRVSRARVRVRVLKKWPRVRTQTRVFPTLLDTRIGKASAVMRALHYSVVMKRELSKKAKLSIFKAVFVPILTYGHESWVMTERMRSQVQASEMRFLRRIEGVALFNKVRSSKIRKSLNIEPLLLRIERSQLRWFGHVSRMPQERLPKQALHAKANGRRPVGRPRTRWTDYIEDLGWNRLGLRPSEMMEVMEDREVWRLNLELLPPQPSRKSGQ